METPARAIRHGALHEPLLPFHNRCVTESPEHSAAEAIAKVWSHAHEQWHGYRETHRTSLRG